MVAYHRYSAGSKYQVGHFRSQSCQDFIVLSEVGDLDNFGLTVSRKKKRIYPLPGDGHSVQLILSYVKQ